MSWTAEMMGIDLDELRRESFIDPWQAKLHREHEAKAMAYWHPNNPPAYETTLTITQAGLLVKYSPDYISKLVKIGEIPAKKVKGRWMIERADILSWLATRR